jgi:hypothetical protein
MPATWKRWYGRDVARLRALVAEGLSDVAIAAELGRTVRAVACARQRLRLTSPPTARGRAQFRHVVLHWHATNAALAAALGVSRAQIARIRDRVRDTYPDLPPLQRGRRPGAA